MAIKASDVGVKVPCSYDWRKMSPAEGGRFCGDCKKVVRDLSGMSEDEARALVAKARYQDLCVRMVVDRDGNVFFGKQADTLLAASLLSRAKRAAAAAAAIALPLATQACTAVTEPLGITQQEEHHDDYSELAGGVEAPNYPPADDEHSARAKKNEANADGQVHVNDDAADPIP